MSLILLGILNSQAAGGGGAGAFDLLETQVLSSSASSVTFTGLDAYSDYKDLQIRFTARSSNTNELLNTIRFYFNGDDASANYSNHRIVGDGANPAGATSTNADYINIYDASAGGNNPAGIFGAGVIDILDFGSTFKYKTLRSIHGGVAGSESKFYFLSGLWRNTSAITSLTLEVFGFSFVADCRFSIYGVKGA